MLLQPWDFAVEYPWLKYYSHSSYQGCSNICRRIEENGQVRDTKDTMSILSARSLRLLCRTSYSWNLLPLTSFWAVRGEVARADRALYFRRMTFLGGGHSCMWAECRLVLSMARPVLIASPCSAFKRLQMKISPCSMLLFESSICPNSDT